jgi:serine/threonine protein kinase
MVQRFVRCRHCGLPHDADAPICPITNLPVREVSGGSMQAVNPAASQGPRTTDDDPTEISSAAALASTRLAAPAPTFAGRYRVRGLIARGGMGVVYDAVDERINRSVAVKVLLPEFAKDTVAVARFHAEVKVLAALAHPRIVTVFDAGTTEAGEPFLVMERLEGEPLSVRIRRESALPMLDAVHVARQVLEALSATHARGILHRDLKPENVFLVRTPESKPSVRVLDFGVARRLFNDEGLSADATLTRAGRVVGTPSYMAFEQATGQRDLDERVDLYAVGVMLFEMLTGQLPWSAKSPVTLAIEMRTKPVLDVRVRRPEVPSWLEAATRSLLARERDHRPPDAKSALKLLRPPPSEPDYTVIDASIDVSEEFEKA